MKPLRLHIDYVPIASIRPDPANPRSHNRKQRRQLAAAIRRFDFTNPILVQDGVIIAGHGRYQAALDLGLETVPIVALSGLSEAERRALMLADNRLAENSSWDPELLQSALQALVDIDFLVDELGLDGLGFDHGEVDIILGNTPSKLASKDEAVELPDDDGPTVTRLGDLFLLGRHLLICGNALEEATYQVLLGDLFVAMVFTDPPYNVPVDGHVMGSGAIRHAEFVMASGEMSEDEFLAFLDTALALMARFSADGSIHFVCMDWRSINALLTAGKSHFSLKNLCVWAKDNGGMGSLYRSQHELVAVFKKGDAPHINNVELGRRGRYRTNVWRYAGVNTLRKGRLADLKAHPTVKPLQLVADAILDCSKVGDLILDPFGGSGTTILACEEKQRRAAVIELEPRFVDTAIRRFEARTGLVARHQASGLSFAELAEQRRSEATVAAPQPKAATFEGRPS